VGGTGAILAALIGRQIELPPSIVERFPELGAARWRRGGVPVLVGGLFLGRASVAAITLWGTVFLARRVPLDPELLLHELRHVHQFQANPAFPLLYLWESLVRGYGRNRFEADARAYAAHRLRNACEPQA
jgi:hypothetical protein